MNYYFFNLNKITNYLSVFEKLEIVFHFSFFTFQRFVQQKIFTHVEGTRLVGEVYCVCGYLAGRVPEGMHG